MQTLYFSTVVLFCTRTFLANTSLTGAFLASFLFMGVFQAQAVGFQRVIIQDPQDRPIEAGIWYPSSSPIPDKVNPPFRQSLALDGDISGHKLPVIIISHGYGGWMGGHANTARHLAEAGYIVIAPTHTGNNYEDESAPPQKWMIDRPRHIKQTIDYIQKDWPGANKVDPAKIGMFGFSAGGYTALVSSGAVPNIEKLLAHCANTPEELVCKLGINPDFMAAGLDKLPRSAWNYDPRIAASVVIAPGLGFAFDKKGLEQVTIPLQLWVGEKDKNVPLKSNSDPLLKYLPQKPDYRLVANAGHFSFMPPCNPLLEKENPKVWQMVCLDHPNFNRHDFHEKLNNHILSFFDRTLGTP